MAWFKPKPKKSPYLSDPGNWRFASLYKHDINLAVARFSRSHLFEERQDQFVTRPLGDWEATGLVHFDRDGPLIPFKLSIGGRLDDDPGLGHFIVQHIQPYSDPNYPEERKHSYLMVEAHVGDPRGEISVTLEKAMHQAAISRKRFLHVRLGKDASDPDVAAAQLREQQYSASVPILRFVVGECIQLTGTPTVFAWEDL